MTPGMPAAAAEPKPKAVALTYAVTVEVPPASPDREKVRKAIEHRLRDVGVRTVVWIGAVALGAWPDCPDCRAAYGACTCDEMRTAVRDAKAAEQERSAAVPKARETTRVLAKPAGSPGSRKGSSA